MLCPSCGNDVPARPICIRCGASLFGNPGMPATALGPVPVPLTFGQKARLLRQCLPLITFSLMVAGYLALVAKAIVPGPPALFYIFIVVVILFTGYDAVQSLRDLFSGVALMQEDLMKNSYRGRGPGHYYGEFERLGKLRLIPKAHFQNSPGSRYRVVYSPVSKVVWALEPPERRSY